MKNHATAPELWVGFHKALATRASPGHNQWTRRFVFGWIRRFAQNNRFRALPNPFHSAEAEKQLERS